MQRILPALRVLLFALATTSLGASIGCGLKGDLVLPESAQQEDQQQQAPPARPSEAQGPIDDPEDDDGRRS